MEPLRRNQVYKRDKLGGVGILTLATSVVTKKASRKKELLGYALAFVGVAIIVTVAYLSIRP